MSLAERLAGLDAVGVGADGVTRLAWTPEDAACREWFTDQAAELGLRVEVDPAGNLWACPDADPPWFGAGSHLDSVRKGGRFDGPLGVACAFELAAKIERPLAVLSFADEEGARFNTPTFGSKALTGRLDLPAVLERRDGDGVTVREAMLAFGVDPDRLADAPAWLERLSGFLEIHIDQSMDVVRAGVPAGVVTALASRRRFEVLIEGQADHAGTTPRDERRDALLGAARLIVAADEVAAELGELTVTTSRLIVEPNAPTTIASQVRLWIDARSPSEEQIDRWLQRVQRDGESDWTVASRSAGVEFDAGLRAALSGAGESVAGRPLPQVICFAGHDAGVIAERVPAAMLLVRNATGVSHSADERIELEDAEVAVTIAVEALR